jgi:drug/metabolite transporter (DMT)-like permease
MAQSRGLLLTVLSGIMYGFLGFFGVQLSKAQLSIPNFMFWRFFIAFLIIFFVNFLEIIKKQWDFRSVVSTLALGGVFYFGSSAFYFLASKNIGTGLSMVAFYSYPAFVIFFSWKIDRFQMTKPVLGALASIFLGLILLTKGEGFDFDLLGTIFALVSALLYAIYVYASKKQTKKLSPLDATLIVCLGGAIVSLCTSVIDGSFMFPQSANAWSNVLCIAIICTGLPILFLLEGLKTVDANSASLLSVLEPVVTVIVGAAFLEEKINLIQFLGIIVILLGVVLVQLEKIKELPMNYPGKNAQFSSESCRSRWRL